MTFPQQLAEQRPHPMQGASTPSVADLHLEKLSLNQSSASLSNHGSDIYSSAPSSQPIATPANGFRSDSTPSPGINPVPNGVVHGYAVDSPRVNHSALAPVPQSSAARLVAASPYQIPARYPDPSFQPNYYPAPLPDSGQPYPVYPQGYADRPPYPHHPGPGPNPDYYAEPYPPAQMVQGPPMFAAQPYGGYPVHMQPPNDHAYLPESSLAEASKAGKRPPKQNQFPPATLENLKKFRTEAEQSNDPKKMLDLAKYLLEAMQQVRIEEPKRAKKARDNLAEEAQKIVKRLTTHSGIGKAGYAEAQFFLGDCYHKGLMLLNKDPEKAFQLYVQGSKQSHPACTFRTAMCYEVGLGTKRDNGRAITFYRKAANLGDPNAMFKLGMILIKGQLGQKEMPREGVSWLKRAAENTEEDTPQALHELGVIYEKEGVQSVIPDPDYARHLFTKAAQLGYKSSQFKLGLAYENGFLNCPVDPRRSIAWYSRAAEQGDLEAELALSGWYMTGAEGVLQQNDTEAYLWARRAADKGYAKAEYACGYYTESGIGVKQDLNDAKKWYMRAAAQNFRRAIQRLKELKENGPNRPQQQAPTRNANGNRPTNSGGKDADCRIM